MKLSVLDVLPNLGLRPPFPNPKGLLFAKRREILTALFGSNLAVADDLLENTQWWAGFSCPPLRIKLFIGYWF